MWLIGGSKTQVRAVEGGRSGERYCEGCKAVVVFRERDLTDKVHAFFVDLFEHTQRRMVCGVCGEDHDVAEFFAAAKPAPEAAKPALGAPAARPKLAAAPAAQTKQQEDAEVDEMLAAMKRKLGKK